MDVFAATGLPTLFFLVVLAVTTGLLLMRSHRRLARQNEDRSPWVRTPRPKLEPAGYSAGAPPEIARWEVSMHDTARDLSAQLDSKMAALQHLLREADRAAAHLEATLQRIRQAAVAGQTVKPDPASVAEMPAMEFRPASQADALRAFGPGSGKESSAAEPLAIPAPADTRYQEIYTLADYGYPPPEIARRVGSPIGEVELILSLRDRR